MTNPISFAGIDLDDERWTLFSGGYRVPYDPRKALRSLELGEDVEAAWQELATELYHQGDVGQASYAAVPHLVRIHEQRGVSDWNTYALVAMIEEARQIGKNPVPTTDLREPYEQAWRRLVQIGLRELDAAEESLLVSCIIAVIAMGKRQFNLGRFAALFDEDERKRLFDEAIWS
ncbi:hypothetical protein [Mesorhizobium sp. 43Arga]